MLPSDTLMKPLTILHTSDWHLGRRLYGRMRYEEFETFLNWLTETITTHQVDILIVAGDIFDTMTPSNKAQALYYEFLGRVSSLKINDKPCCQHIVIVAGNHDSPTFLDAPSGVLKFLNVHVIGTACEDVSEEVLTLTNHEDEPLCIIAAVPYLRDRDVRGSYAGESSQDKDANVLKGIQAHYDGVAAIAKAEQETLIKAHGRPIPIIATGHLFAAGGKTTDDDGVRDLYVGSLGKVSADMFDDCFDYVALGHLHVPQRVGGSETIRYSGSPIPMGFGEARQQKQVLLIQFAAEVAVSDQPDPAPLSNETLVNSVVSVPPTTATPRPIHQSDLFADLFVDTHDAHSEVQTPADDKRISQPVLTSTPSSSTTQTMSDHRSGQLATTLLYQDTDKQMQVITLPIPCFQKLAQISGDLPHIAQAIRSLSKTESIWLEVVYTGDEIVSDLREQVQALSEGLPCEILKIKNSKTYNKVLNQQNHDETLADLDEMEVFKRCLQVNNIAQSQHKPLLEAYEQIVYEIRHEDRRAD